MLEGLIDDASISIILVQINLVEFINLYSFDLLIRWYKDLDPGNILGGYIRERPVECYFWALGIFYEPHYAKARMNFAKFVKIFSLFDDTYDSYGTVEELCRFNNSVQR